MKLQGWPSTSRNSVGASAPRAAADRPEHQLDLALLHLLFPSTPPVRSNVTCKEEKNTSKVSDLPPFQIRFYLCFISLFLSFFFWFPLLCFR